MRFSATIADTSQPVCARLGFAVEEDEKEATIAVEGLGGRIPSSSAELFVGNSGTTARFLTAFVALGHGDYVVDGVARMRERPIADCWRDCSALGVDAQSSAGNGCPPVVVHGRGIAGGSTQLGAQTSSQFLTALLLIAPAMRGWLERREQWESPSPSPTST